VYVADAHAHVQRLVSVVKMATVLEELCTTEEQPSVVNFLWAKKLSAGDVHKEIFSSYYTVTLGDLWIVHRLEHDRFLLNPFQSVILYPTTRRYAV
jgi:hypothetical protein